MKKTLQEFKEFIAKGNAIDLAVGVVIGAAFAKIVSSLVADIIMPLIGLIVGKVNLSTLFLALNFESYPSLAEAKQANVPLLMYGNFLQSIIDLLFVGFAVFLMIKAITRAQNFRKVSSDPTPEATTKTCPQCCSVINIKARLCPFCQSGQETK